MRHAVTIAFLAQNYPAAFQSEQAARDYDSALGDLDPAAALDAARKFWASDDKGFRPTPGQLRALIQAPALGGADAAWLSVTKAIAHYAGKPTHETPNMPSFGDPLTAVALEAIGGFRQFLSGLSSERAEFTRARFLRAYKSAVTGGAVPLQLPGEAKRLEAREAKGGAR